MPTNIKDFERSFKKTKSNFFKEIDKKYRAGIIQIFNSVILGSPILTGRFRGNWQVSMSTPNYEIVEFTVNKKGNITAPIPKADKNIDSSTTFETPLYLTNNLPYAIPLAEGHSRQRSSGWIQVIALDGKYKLEQALQRVKADHGVRE